MVIHDKIVLRQLEARDNWLHPLEGLQRAHVSRILSQALPEIGGSRSWRKEPFKKYFEDFQAALFSFGITRFAPDYEWQYSYGETRPPETTPPFADADCFLRCRFESEFVYKPIQLKELVPENLALRSSHTSSLQSIIDSIAKKYTAQAGMEILVVAIYINRATKICFKDLRVPSALAVQQIWVFGRLDACTGFISGGNPRKIEECGFGKQIRFPMPSCD